MHVSIRKLLTKHSFLLRIMITIFVFICIPALIVSYSVTSRTYQEYVASAIRTDKAIVAGFFSYFGNQFSRMRLLASRIGYERRVSLEYIREKPYNTQEVMRTLKNYIEFVPVVSSIGILFGDGYVYSDVGRLSLDSYLKEAIDINGLGTGVQNMPMDETRIRVEDDIKGILTDFDATYRMYSTFGKITNKENLFIFVPVTMTSNLSGHMMVIYKIDNASFQYSTVEEGLGKNYYFGIFDSQGNIMFSGSKVFSDITDIADEESIINNTSNKGIPLTLGKIDYTAYCIKNADLDLSYVMYSASEDVGTSLESFYQLLKGSVFWVIIMFAVLCVATAYMNYRPVSKLVNRIRATGKDSDGKVQNEFQAINNAIEDLSSQNVEMHELLSTQRDLLVDSLVSRFIEGVDVTREEIQHLKVDISGPYFCTMIMQTPDKHAKELHGLAVDLSKECGAVIYIVEIPYKPFSAVFCNLPDKSRLPREKIAGHIAASLAKAGCGSRKIGVGMVVESPADIRTSYYTALSSFENDQIQDVVFFEDVIEKFEIIRLCPTESILKLIQCIKHGDKENANTELLNITGYMVSSGNSTLIKQYMCFNIINTLVPALMKLEISMTIQEISSILHHSTIEEGFQRTLFDFISRTCDKVVEKRRNEEDALLNNIVRFVDENITNSNISLTSVADRFELPIYSISRMFKKATGTGFSEYITLKRIEYSKLLLMTLPDKSMNEIALLSGFSNVSYFIKIFKNLSGMTPSKYRTC
jgi:AraC-like DNA-binding protein